ncbi:MAG TPA: site-2 protease family protein, partial [Tepidisphaeraceae bacterium]
MKAVARHDDWIRVMLVVLMILPIAVLFLLPGGAIMMGVFWFWPLLLLGVWLLWLGIGAAPEPVAAEPTAATVAAPVAPPLAPPVAAEPPDAVRDVMEVRAAEVAPGGAMVFRGPLKVDSETAFKRLKGSLEGRGVPLLRADDTFGAAIVLVPPELVEPRERARKRRRRASPWVNWLLFALTIVTTTWAGAAQAGADVLRHPASIAAGLPYAVGLIAILGIHELGHYFTAKYHGMDVTPPFFIPVPFALGTFGAFIRMRSTPENRKALFDVAVAGPLAGLVVAVPVLLVGLRSSTIVLAPTPADAMQLGTGTSVGSSILFALLAKLSMGQALQYGGCVVKLSPLAFAGWLGLFITALNLLPIGQLDGGHMAQAMFGGRAGRVISLIAMWTLFLLALFVWPGLFLFAIVVFFLAAGGGEPPLDDVTPVTPGRRLLGELMFLVLVLILAPLPRSLWSAVGIHCP